MASWINIQNIFPVLNIFLMTSPRTFLEGWCFSLTALQALGILSAHEQQFQSCCFGKWPQGGSMSLCPTPFTGGTSALGKVLFLDWQLALKACVPFLLPPLLLFPGQIPVPATPLWGGCFHPQVGWPKGRRLEPHHQETWSPRGFSKLFQPRGSTPFGCSMCSFTAEEPAWIWRLWARAEGSRLARSTRRGSLAGKSFPALSTPSESILGKQACPGFRAVITAQITMAGME